MSEDCDPSEGHEELAFKLIIADALDVSVSTYQFIRLPRCMPFVCGALVRCSVE